MCLLSRPDHCFPLLLPLLLLAVCLILAMTTAHVLRCLVISSPSVNEAHDIEHRFRYWMNRYSGSAYLTRMCGSHMETTREARKQDQVLGVARFPFYENRELERDQCEEVT